MVMTMPRAQQIKILIVLGMMSLLTALSGSSTNLAMPKISADLMISSSAATWIVSIGLITTSVLLVMFGHIGDLVSKNLVFLIGEMVFIVNWDRADLSNHPCRSRHSSRWVGDDHGEFDGHR